MSSPIVAILNCFSPATGANISQTVVFSDGSAVIYGEEALARIRIGQLVNARFPEPMKPLKKCYQRKPRICKNCHHCNPPGNGGDCDRCQHPLPRRGRPPR